MRWCTQHKSCPKRTEWIEGTRTPHELHTTTPTNGPSRDLHTFIYRCSLSLYSTVIMNYGLLLQPRVAAKRDLPARWWWKSRVHIPSRWDNVLSGWLRGWSSRKRRSYRIVAPRRCLCMESIHSVKRWPDVDSDVSVPLLKVEQTSITNSVCACRHINSFVSAPLNATKIVGMKRIHLRMVMVNPEFFIFDLQVLKKAIFFREVTPRSLFYGHLKAIFLATASSASRYVAPLYKPGI